MRRRPTSGWSSGWATPARRTPAPGTTSGYLVVDELAAGSAAVHARTRPAAPTSSRAGSVPRAGGPRVVLARPRSLHERVRRTGRGAGHVLQGAARPHRRDPRRARHRPSAPCASSSAAATTATTGCGRCAPRSAPATSTGSGSASAGRPGRQDAGRLRARGLLLGRAQGAALPGRPGRRRRRVAAHRRPRAHPEPFNS